MHQSRTSCALVAYSWTSDVSGTYKTGVLGSSLCSDVRRPPSGGPLVVVANLWS